MSNNVNIVRSGVDPGYNDAGCKISSATSGYS